MDEHHEVNQMDEYFHHKKRDPSLNRYSNNEAMEAFADLNRKVFAPKKLYKKAKELARAQII